MVQWCGDGNGDGWLRLVEMIMESFSGGDGGTSQWWRCWCKLEMMVMSSDDGDVETEVSGDGERCSW